PGTGIFGVYDERVDMNDGATQGWSTMHFRETELLKLETLSIPLELIAGRLSGSGVELMRRLEDYPHMAMWCMAVRAETQGTVRPGLGGTPVVRYSFVRRDMERLRLGAYFVAQMHVAAGARAVLPNVYGMPYELGRDEIDKMLEAPLDPRCWTAIMSHLFGGCVMGADPSRSVCDGRGAVHGVQGLYIADASAFPTTIGVNPQHTIMALARLRAHQLMEAA
ncbi:MAG: GMC family oxidoreductase, partial [Myxococcota bacterium]|nr:GMC family oxidoreductase [Myxococcota bacterium]